MPHKRGFLENTDGLFHIDQYYWPETLEISLFDQFRQSGITAPTQCGLECGRDYYAVSYRYEIIQWLTKCSELATNRPKTRETLSQYIQTLKKLTHLNMDSKEWERLCDIMEANIEATQEVINNAHNFHHYLIEKYLVIPISKWTKGKNLSCILSNNFESGAKNASIRIKKQHWVKSIELHFDSQNYNGLYYGVTNPKQDSEGKTLLPGYNHNTKLWPYGYKDEEKYSNLYLQHFSDLKEGLVAKKLISEIENILKVIDNKPEDFPMTH